MVDNPRFPHRLEIYRADRDENGTPKTDEEGNEISLKVFESECGLRDMVRGLDIDSDVVKADYKLSLPKHSFIILKGDYIKFYNSINNQVKEGKIEEAKVFNLGANIWFNENGNG